MILNDFVWQTFCGAGWRIGLWTDGSLVRSPSGASSVNCGLEQVTFSQLNVYSVHMFLKSRNKSSTELMLVVELLLLPCFMS